MDTNIQVGIRVRPLISREIQSKQKTIWKTDRNCIYSFDKQNSYEFDKVFGQNSTTKEIYDILGKPIVDKVMEGFNGTLFAYGQTASGKTHTIMGDLKSEPGIVPLAIMDVFNHIEHSPNREFLMRASYLEIYNEEITDLVTNMKDNIKIRNNIDNEIVIENITEESIISYDQAMDLINTGKRNRMIGKTNMNERSSRSHVIFRLVVESRQLPDGLNMSEFDGAVIVSELNLVDLAGSERVAQTGAQGVRLKESGFINTSLMTLGLVIRKLSEKDGHVPYRDSKLTRILQNSLGGNARTSVICTVSPVVLEETTQTLKFAGRAKNVTNKPIINEVVDGDTQMRRQMNEIRSLKRKIKELEGGAMHAEMLQEQDKMMAEKQMYKTKIEEQETKIQKLLKEIVCSGRTKFEGSKTRASRRQTWCPGGLSTLRSLENKPESMETSMQHVGFRQLRNAGSDNFMSPLPPVFGDDQKNKKDLHVSFRNTSKHSATTHVQANDGQSNESLHCDDSFEKHEFIFLKEEFDEYKLKMSEDLKQAMESLREKEMEAERLKNELRDQKTLCERLKENNETDQLREAYVTIEKASKENDELKQEIDQKCEQNDKLRDEVEQMVHKCKENELLQHENEELSQKCIKYDELHKEMEEMTHKYQENKELQRQIEELSHKCQENENLKQQLEEMTEKHQEKEQLKQTIEELSQKCQENEKLQMQLEEMARKQQENEQLQQTMNELTNKCQQNEKLQEKIKEMTQNYQENDQLRVKVEEMFQENQRLQQQIEELSQKCQQHENLKIEEITEKCEQNEQLQKQVEELLQRCQQNEDCKHQIEEVSKNLKEELEALRKNNQDLKSDIGTFKDVIESQEEESKMLNNQYESKCKEFDALKEKFDEMNNAPETPAESDIFPTASIENHSEYEQTIQGLHSTVKSLEEEMNDIVTNGNALKQQWILKEFELNADKENLHSECNRLKNLLEQKEETLKVTIEREHEKDQEIEKNKHSLENLLDIEKKNQELQNLLDTATEQSRDYQSQLQQLNEQLDRMNNLENNPDTESENLKVLKEQIIHLEMNLQNKVQLVAEKEERISHLEDQQLEFQNVYNNEKDKYQKLEERNSILENSKEDYEMKIAEQVNSIEELTIQLGEMKELESTNQNTLATKSKELDAMQGELNTIVNANKDLHIAIDGLKQEISELSEKPVHSNNAIISNDNELADMQQRVENNTKELQEKCERILHLETEHEEFQQIFNAEKAKLLQAEEKCFHLQNEKEEVEEEKEKLLKEQQELSITIQQLKESLSEMQLLLENKEKELNGTEEVVDRKLLEEIESLKFDIERKNEEFSSLSSEHETIRMLNEKMLVAEKELRDSLSNEKQETIRLKECYEIEKERTTKLQEEFEQGRAELDCVKGSLQSKSEECNELRAEIEEHQASALEWDRLSSLQRVENEALQLDVETKLKEILELQEQIETLTASINNDDLERIQNDLNAKVDEIKVLNERIVEFNNKETELKAEIVEKGTQLEQKDSEIKEVRESYQKQIDIFDKEREELECLKTKNILLENEKEELAYRLQEVADQKDNLLDDLGEIRTALVNMEDEIKTLKDSEFQLKEIISLGKEKLEQVDQDKDILQDTINKLTEENSNFRSTLSTNEETITKLTEEREDLLQKVEDAEVQSSALLSENEEINHSLRDKQEQLARLQEELATLTTTLKEKEVAYEEEKSLCKSAYEHECKQNNARVEELVKCLKDLQSENKSVGELNGQLQNEVLQLREDLSQNGSEDRKKDELIESLKAKMQDLDSNTDVIESKLQELNERAEAMDELKEENNQLKTKIFEKEKQRVDLEKALNEVNIELEDVRKRLDKSTTLDTKADEPNDRPQRVSTDSSKDEESLKDQIKKLEYRIQLREEESVVYRNRIHEQDEEIEALTKKKNEMRDQLKKLVLHIEEVRRPSGNPTTVEWEEAVTRLDVKAMKLQTINEKLTEKNTKLSSNLKKYETDVKNAKIRIDQLESRASDADKENEILTKEISKKKEDVKKLSDALKETYSRMGAAEKSRKEFQGKLDTKEAEMKRIMEGLKTAFERYKHYKGENLEKEKEINSLRTKLTEAKRNEDFLTSKLTELETKIRSSMKHPKVEKSVLEDISQSAVILNTSKLTAANQIESVAVSTNEKSHSVLTNKTNLTTVSVTSTCDGHQKSVHETSNGNQGGFTITTNQSRSQSLTSAENIFNQSDLSLSSLENDAFSTADKKKHNFQNSPVSLPKESNKIFESMESSLRSPTTFSPNSSKENNKALQNMEESHVHPSFTGDMKKRKSDEPLESFSRRRKTVQASPKKEGENECNQQ